MGTENPLKDMHTFSSNEYHYNVIQGVTMNPFYNNV